MNHQRPILFSGEMVRAILEGRKTQTRRVIQPQPPATVTGAGMYALMPPRNGNAYRWDWTPLIANAGKVSRGYYPGDRLWVRETWRIVGRIGSDYLVEYAADKAIREIDVGWEGPTPELDAQIHQERCHPSIHMPRWASRLTLEIVKVRVERVQDISAPHDCCAEGVQCPAANSSEGPEKHRQFFRELWDKINSKRGFGWDANPWVWVIEFKRGEPQG